MMDNLTTKHSGRTLIMLSHIGAELFPKTGTLAFRAFGKFKNLGKDDFEQRIGFPFSFWSTHEDQSVQLILEITCFAIFH